MRMNLASATCTLVLAAVLLGVSSCDRDPVGDTGGPYSGMVIDSVTKIPIDSAMVSLGDTSWVDSHTNSTGYFEGAAFGSTVTIYVRKEGYETESKVRDLTKNATDLLFQLVPVNNR